MKPEPREGLIAAPRDQRELWNQFRQDRELIDRLRITPNEIDTLSHCALLGTLTCKQDLLFILRQIREATHPITPEQLVELKPHAAYEDSFEEPVLPVLRLHPRIDPAALRMTEPGSYEELVRGHLPEHVGISVWLLILVGGLMLNFAIAIYRWREHFMASIGASAAQSIQSTSWLTKIDDFSMLLGWEIVFVGVIAAVMAFRSRTRHRHLKVRPI